MNPLLAESHVAAVLDLPRSVVEVKSCIEHHRNGKRLQWTTGEVFDKVWLWHTAWAEISGDWVKVRDVFLTTWKGSGE